MMLCIIGNTCGNKSHDEVFVQRISLAEDCQMQKHHRKKFARFGENESDVVDVREGCIAKRGGQG